MKYILIGGSGFIGQHFKDRLQESIILNLDLNEGINSTEFEYCDINEALNVKTNTDKFAEITVIHLAAVHFDFQKNYYKTNIEGTKNILKWIDSKKNIVNYVFFSSVATYGNASTAKNEKDNQQPYNDYGKSKLEAEKVIFEWKKYKPNIKTIIIRPAVVFGEYNFGNVYNLLKQIDSGMFAIIGNGKNIKSIAYAPNIVSSVLFCLNNIQKNLFVYNYSDYPQNTIEEQSNLISNLLGKKRPIKVPLYLTKLLTIPVDLLEKIFCRDLKINSMRVKKFTLSTNFNSDLIRNYGYTQKFTIEEALKKTLHWVSTTQNIESIRKEWYNKASKL